MGKIKIQNELIEFKEKELKVDDLLFWEENPRVYSILRMQKQYFRHLQSRRKQWSFDRAASVSRLK